MTSNARSNSSESAPSDRAFSRTRPASFTSTGRYLGIVHSMPSSINTLGGIGRVATQALMIRTPGRPPRASPACGTALAPPKDGAIRVSPPVGCPSDYGPKLCCRSNITPDGTLLLYTLSHTRLRQGGTHQSEHRYRDKKLFHVVLLRPANPRVRTKACAVAGARSAARRSS